MGPPLLVKMQLPPARNSALHEHEHQLAAYCATCERWAVFDLEQLIADGHGELCIIGWNRLDKAGAHYPVEAREALSEALQEPITLHREDGVLVAEIAYRAPLPLVDNVAECSVGGPGFETCLLRIPRRSR